jgi:hypothetical protein
MATNLGGNLGQSQNAVTTIGNIAPATGAVGTMSSHLSQQPPTPQQQTVGTSIDTPMEVDSAMQSVGESYFIPLDDLKQTTMKLNVSC